MTNQGQIKNRTCVGVILGPHGVNGAMRIKSFCERPQSIIDYNPLIIEDYPEVLSFNIVANLKSTLQVTSEKIKDRDSAMIFKGKLLFAERNKLPKSDAEEYYFADLIGLKVKEHNGQPFGSVKNVGNYGAGSFLEIRHDQTSKTIFLPFDKKAFPVINLQDQYLIVKEFPKEFLKEPN